MFLCFPSCRLVHFLSLSPSRVRIKRILESKFPEIHPGGSVTFEFIGMHWLFFVESLKKYFKNIKITCVSIVGVADVKIPECQFIKDRYG